MKRAWFPDEHGEHRVFWHWQRLKGNGLREGRAWLHVPRAVFSIEWMLKWSSPGVSLGLDDEPSATLALHLVGGSVYLGFESRLLNVLGKERTSTYLKTPITYRSIEDRELSLRTHHGSVWWRVWTNPMETRGDTPRWREGNWSPLDAALGRYQFRRVTGAKESAAVPLPEWAYAGTVTLETLTWKRPRWPWARVRQAATVDVEGGVPIPGKGENSWDCGDDAIFSLSCSATTVPEAIARMVQSVLETRRRHGGANWHPPIPEVAR